MPEQLPVLDQAIAAVCCAPLASAPLSADDARVLAGQLKALADPARLRLLSLMMANEDLEACTCDLTEALALSQPTVSHHLKKLNDAGLVFAHRKQGSWTYYRVVPEALTSLANVIAPAESAALAVTGAPS
jgi:ArsR family transcriptional regulator